jgi:curved DNA-binding protein CbpA
MSQVTFSNDWLELLADPFAVLGIALSMDEKSINKHYRNLAKQLHPDRYAQAEPKQQEFAGQLVARLINPAYGKIKQERDRVEVLAVLRLQAQQLAKTGSFVPTSEAARLLMQQSGPAAISFYETHVQQLAEQQYESFTQFGNITHQLHELNMVYLQRKLESGTRPTQALMQPRAFDTAASRMSMSSPAPTPSKPEAAAQAPTTDAVNAAADVDAPVDSALQESYASRHYERAQQYIEKGAYDRAAQEMKDALRLVADKSEYHALLSYTYLLQKLPGMAAVYCRQALKLNAEDEMAQKLAKKLKIQVQPATTKQSPPSAKTVPKAASKAPSERGWLKQLFRRS